MFRNDSDDSLKVNLERIRLNITFSEDNRQALDTLTFDQAADLILKPGAKNPAKSRFPIPIGGPKGGHDKKWGEEIGRASCRGREEISVGGGSFKKKRHKIGVI